MIMHEDTTEVSAASASASEPASAPGVALTAAPKTAVTARGDYERTALAAASSSRSAFDRTLDAVDEIADAVAQSLGLRDR